MRIWLMNTGLSGGAATATIRLLRGLKAAGHDCHLLHTGGTTNEVGFIKCPLLAEPRSRRILNKAKARMFPRAQLPPAPKEGRVFWPITSARTVLPPPNTPLPDVLHLNWVQNWLDYSSFLDWLPRSIPVFWTLHDVFPMTGGCVCTWGCERFVQHCGNCPQLESGQTDDPSTSNLEQKRSALASRPVHVIAPSRWMLENARRSSVFKHSLSFHHILNGLDLKVFRPIPKNQAREVLSICGSNLTLCFGLAGDWNNPYKGFSHLKDALALLPISQRNQINLLTFGPDQPPELPPRICNHHFGLVPSGSLQTLIYSASDSVLIPSLQDNSPQVLTESLACGTSVIGFPVGGIPELIRHRQTGILTRDATAASLADAISELLSNRELTVTLGHNARNYAFEHLDSVAQAGKHTVAYEAARQLLLSQA